jgi:stage V sporulation protein SpoVS
MATAKIQASDGRIITVQVPDGATEQQIMEFVQENYSPDQASGSAEQPVSTQPSFGDKAIGVAENVGSLVSGAVAEPIAGLAGIAQSINPFAEQGAGVRAIDSVSDALTYQPRTEEGQRQGQAIGEFIEPAAKQLSKAEKFLGNSALKLTGSPALAAMAHTLPTAALELIGVKGARNATRVDNPSQRLINKTLVDSAPDVATIKKASRAIFTELDNSGVAIKQESLLKLNEKLDKLAKSEGIDIRVTPEADGAISAVKDAVAKGESLPLSEMDTLRTIAKNSIVASDPNKMRVGSAVVDEIDNFLDNIKGADIDRGAQINASEVGKKYKTARTLYGRAKRSEMLQAAIEMGSSRKAGVEKGIRNELNNLLNRKKSRKFLSKEDVAAIRKVTDGDFKQNFASLIGGMGLKLENSPSLFSSVVGGSGAGVLASSVPGLSGVVAPVAIGAVTVGTVAKEIAKKMTKDRAAFLDTITRAGKDPKEITRAYLRAVPKNQRNTGDLSDLLLDPNIDLSELQSIANETVNDAVKAAMFKRDMLQATAALGVGASSGELNKVENNNE